MQRASALRNIVRRRRRRRALSGVCAREREGEAGGAAVAAPLPARAAVARPLEEQLARWAPEATGHALALSTVRQQARAPPVLIVFLKPRSSWAGVGVVMVVATRCSVVGFSSRSSDRLPKAEMEPAAGGAAIATAAPFSLLFWWPSVVLFLYWSPRTDASDLSTASVLADAGPMSARRE